MSKGYWTWIRIGGAVERPRVEALLRVIRRAQVGLDWFGLFEPEDPEHLLESLTDDWLWLCDTAARDGDLPGMEEVCQNLGLPYRKHIEGCCGDGAVLIDWRPGMTEPLVRTGSNAGDEISLVDEEAVRKALTALEAGCVSEATAILRRLCPDVPDVPPFTIV